MVKFSFENQKHPFHLVDPSPHPLVASLGAFAFTFGSVMYFHSYTGGHFLMFFGFFTIIYIMFVWWRDIIREGTYEGTHTHIVQLGLRMGMLLFIVSEIMFFFAFFWAFFHSSIAPDIGVGGIWPPEAIPVLSPWEIPLLNTVILLTSGASITWCHHALLIGKRNDSLNSLLLTIFLAIIFTFFQGFEYYNSPFTISDGIYGSTFFLATGFHGFHVFIGTCFLVVCTQRLFKHHFTTEHHFGFEASAWYWHFVDVVWLFLFVTIYWWGS